MKGGKKRFFFNAIGFGHLLGKKKTKEQRNEVTPLKEKTSVGCIFKVVLTLLFQSPIILLMTNGYKRR
jgi:hypothetical protein